MADLPTAPDYTPPNVDKDLLNKVSAVIRENLAAWNKVVPLTYGRDLVYPYLAAIHTDEENGFWYGLYVIGKGPIEEVEKVYIDGIDVNDEEEGFLLNEGAELNVYLGTQEQEVDPLFASAVPGFSDAMKGFAYLSLKIPSESTAGFPKVSCEIKGQLLYDPRIGAFRGPSNSDQITIPHHAAHNVGTQLTFEAWILAETDVSPGNAAVQKLGADGGFDFVGMLGNESVRPRFRLRLGPDATLVWADATTFLPYGTKAHWAGTYDAATRTMRVYVNGELEREVDLTSQGLADWYIADTTAPLELCDGTSWVIQEARLWNVVRTPEEIKANLYRQLEGNEAGLVGYWRCDEKDGDTVYDYSPTGAHGMIVGAGSARVPALVGLAPASTCRRYYSDNPAIAHANFAHDYSDNEVMWDTVPAAADYCDEIVGTGEQAERRRRIGLTMYDSLLVEDWLEVLRAYSRTFTPDDNGKMRFIPNRKDVEAPGALELPGYGKIGYAQNPNFGFSSPTLTMECRFIQYSRDVNPDGDDYQMLLRPFNTPTGVNGRLHIHDDGRLRGSLPNGVEGAFGTAPVALNEWHHAALVYDGTYCILYLDGEEVSRREEPGVSMEFTGFLLGSISTSHGANTFHGKIDEVRVWTTARTPEQIQENMGRELAGDEEGLFAYWRLNERTGNIAHDATGNNRHLTCSGEYAWAQGDYGVLPHGVALDITADVLVDDPNNPELNIRDDVEKPTVVVIEYTDASTPEWKKKRVTVKHPGVDAGTVPVRESTISMNGIHSASQAYREGVERLNSGIADLDARVTIFNEGMKVLPGSVVALTDDIGLYRKLFRVMGKNSLYGIHTLALHEYEPEAFSDAILTEPSVPDTHLGNPMHLPELQNLTASEELFTRKDGTTSSRLRVTFDPVRSPWVRAYLVDIYQGEQLIFRLSSSTTTSGEVVSPALPQIEGNEPVLYTIKARTESAYKKGPVTTTDALVQGKLLPPGDVPQVSARQTGAGEITLNWQRAVDIDIWRYLVRLGTVDQAWEEMEDVELVDGLSHIVKGLEAGTYKVGVKAIDSVKNESAAAAFDTITVQGPGRPQRLTGYEIGGEVFLTWEAAEGYVDRYRVSYQPAGGGTLVVLDEAKTLRLSSREVPEGNFTFLVTALDQMGNESQPATVTFSVSSDASSFVAADYEFTSPTLLNMREYTLDTTPGVTYYITAMPGDKFVSNPSTFQTYAAEALANFHSPGTSRFSTEIHDFGALLSGTWRASVDYEDLKGEATVKLRLSKNNTQWDEFEGLLSVKGEYRYAQIVIEATDTETLLVRRPPLRIMVNVVPLAETGTANTSTAGLVKITLSRQYALAKKIDLSAQGSAARLYYDDIVLNDNGVTSFKVAAKDTFGQFVAVPISWRFEGV